MSVPPIIDGHGRTLSFDSMLGSPGGEGTVFAISNDRSLAAKIYHPNQRNTERFEKLRAIISVSNPRLLAVAAWPQEIIYEKQTKQPIGFLMPRLPESQSIQNLYNPLQRFKYFPKATWAFQVRAAINLAAAFDEVHQVGCLMGDINERNELISQDALVRLIDCDSFQVTCKGRQHLCEVGVAHYTPPELQGKSFRGLVRTENHDRFGLAVLIYQLLFAGRHPYMGIHKDDVSFEQLISQYRFAQGPNAKSVGMAPPLHTPTFEDIPSYLQTLYRRAFEKGSNAGIRPKAQEWHGALKQLESEMATCNEDAGHKYWSGAKSCVWCRLANEGGPDYFYGVASQTVDYTVDENKLREIITRLENCRPPECIYDRKVYNKVRHNTAVEAPEGLVEHRNIAMSLVTAVILCCVCIILGLVHKAFLITGMLGLVVFVYGYLFIIRLRLGIWNIVHADAKLWTNYPICRNMKRYGTIS